LKRVTFPVILLSAVFLLTYCSSTPASFFSENFVIPADFTGIVHAGETRTQEEAEYLRFLGTSWVLHTFYWDRIEPEQGRWDFSDYDSIVNFNKAANVKVFGVLAYDNWWIHEEPSKGRYIPPHRVADYCQYVRRTVEHFKGRVDAWCIWNEPNFSFWTGTNKEFIELFRQAAAAVREVDSEVILLGGAFNRGAFGLPERFIRNLFKSGAMENVDAVAFHPYELNFARSMKIYNKFKKIVDDYGFGNKIWVTEMGYPTGGLYPTKVSERNFPEYIIKTTILLAAAGSKKLFWYQLFDPIDRSEFNSEDYFGLVRSEQDYTSKGAEAFRLCARYFSDSTCYMLDPVVEGLPNTFRLFCFQKNNGVALVFWNEGIGLEKISIQLPGEDYEMHNLISGRAYPIQSEEIVYVGSMPVFITWRNNDSLPDSGQKPIFTIIIPEFPNNY
jgi:hypothetical protein